MTHTSVTAALGYKDAAPGDIIGWWRHGAIRLLGGGAPDDDHEGDGDGEGHDDDDDGGDGEDHDSLFDGDEGDDDGDGGGGDDLTPAMQAAIEREANRIADRRINQILSDRDRDRRGSTRDRDRDRDDEETRSGRVRVRDSALREARLAYREYVGDEVKFVSREERAYAADLAAGLLRDRLAAGEDVEDAGRAVARDVAGRVQALRRTYERGVIDRLKSRGHLPGDFKVKSQPKRSEDKPGPGSTFKKGEERAREQFPERFQTTK